MTRQDVEREVGENQPCPNHWCNGLQLTPAMELEQQRDDLQHKLECAQGQIDHDSKHIAELLAALQLAYATIVRLERHAPGTAKGTRDVMDTAIAAAEGRQS